MAAPSGQQALALIEEMGIDLVLLDLMLPDLPGTAVCQRLRASARTRNLPVIMMTARAEAIDVAAGVSAGVDDYVTKPFRMHDLVQRVRALLRRRVPVATRTVHAAAASPG